MRRNGFKHLGATIIGTAGGPAKSKLAPKHGCDHVMEYREADVGQRVREITRGKGVRAVYDGVGKNTFLLHWTVSRRMLLTFGNASGPVPAFERSVLAARGSLFLIRPIPGHYIATGGGAIGVGAGTFQLSSGKEP